MKLEVFKNAGFEIRGGLINGEPYFVLADVCKALGLEQVSRVKDRLNKDGVTISKVIDSMGRTQQATFINESNLYKVIFQSRKEEAIQFQEWVTSEVLPSIRKHGAYLTPQKVEDILTNPDTIIQLATQLKAEKEAKEKAMREKLWIASKREATAMATASREKRKAQKLEILLDESSEWATVKKIQIATGKKYNWRKLKKVSKEMNIPPRKVHDINYGEVNSYHNSVWMKCYNIDLKQVA